MNTTQHTPGPWKIYDKDSDTTHIGTVSANPNKGWDYKSVCNMYEDKADNYDTSSDFSIFENAKANAQLIAAAPELLRVAEMVLEYATIEMPKILLDAATSAITSARGEA